MQRAASDVMQSIMLRGRDRRDGSDEGRFEGRAEQYAARPAERAPQHRLRRPAQAGAGFDRAECPRRIHPAAEGRLCRRPASDSPARGRWTACPSGSGAGRATGAGRRIGGSSQGAGPARSRRASSRAGQGAEAGRQRRRSECSRRPRARRHPFLVRRAVGRSSIGAKDPALDREIAKRFGQLREEVLKSKATGWRDTPETLLAAIILLDQFSRNIFRGTAGRSRRTGWRWNWRSWRWSGAGSRRRRSRGEPSC